MKEEVKLGSEISRASGEIEGEREPWDAGRVIRTVLGGCHAMDFSIPPAWKAIIGQHAKLLLEEGWPGDLVSAAALMAVLRGKPGLVQHIAGDLILAERGVRMDRSEYEQKVQLYAADQKGKTLLAEHAERRAKRIEEIERRRNGS